MVKIKVIYMARKRKRNEEAYERLCNLPNQKELNNANIEQDVQLGVTQVGVGSKRKQKRS